jgi:ribosomal protein S18 acetylase RimI-like enzyme
MAAPAEFQWVEVNGNHTNEQIATMTACITEFGLAKPNDTNSYEGLTSGSDRWSGAEVLLLSNKGMLMVAHAGKQQDMSEYEGMLYVTLVCVLPQFRRQGNATRLLGELIHRFGHVSMVLDLDGGQDLYVKELYEHFGFEVVESLGEDGEVEDYIMVRPAGELQ